MSIVDSLNKGRMFKKEKSTEGEFRALKGIYHVTFVKQEQVEGRDGGPMALRAEFKVVETLSGTDSYAKFPEFRKFYIIEGEGAGDKKKGIGALLNALFTAGIDVSTESDEVMFEGIKQSLGADMYVSARGWTPDDSDKEVQLFNFMKETVAIKKAEKEREKVGHPL